MRKTCLTLSGLLLSTACFSALAQSSTSKTDSSYCTVGHVTYISSQIGLDPVTHTMPTGVSKQIDLAFQNLKHTAKKAGGSLDNVVKLNVTMSDMDHTFPLVKKAIARYFNKPYPTRIPISAAVSPAGPNGRLIYFSVGAVMYNKHLSAGKHCG